MVSESRDIQTKKHEYTFVDVINSLGVVRVDRRKASKAIRRSFVVIAVLADSFGFSFFTQTTHGGDILLVFFHDSLL